MGLLSAGQRASIRPSRLDPGLAFRECPHKKGRSSLPREGFKVTTSVLESGTANERELAKSRHGESKRKKNASSAENTPTVKRTQSRRPELKQGQYADLVLQSCPVRYESTQNSPGLTVSAAFKKKSRHPLILRGHDFEPRKFSMVALLRSALFSEEHQPSLFLSKKSNS